ncbi:MAG: Asp23/Gls24 family envelope stress response protein [Oscillospiraceae bacterium]|nr:Asp23/Gls24 family envelope stress response protein [Oscillospiraceae bacterium]
MAENKGYITMEDNGGTINISEDVVATIAIEAIGQVEGVAAVTNTLGKDIAELFGKKNAPKGVTVDVADDRIVITAHISVAYGYGVNTVAENVQTAVTEAVESMTSVKVSAVNVHVSSVSFRKAES